MKKTIKYITIILALTAVVSCEDIFDPLDENLRSLETIESDPETAEGILIQGYTKVFNQYRFTEVATDDAVHNQLDNNLKRMALGELSAIFNPASQWDEYERVFYMNQFIEIINKGKVVWKRDEEISALFDDRLKGEALALRGLFHYYILQAHAGIGISGNLMGIPYYKEFIEPSGNFNIQRLSFQESVNAIMADFDEAILLLPTDYSSNPSDVDPKYGDIDFSKYVTVNGDQYTNRISGRIVKGLKARLALFAASPSFLNGSGYYETAASIASELLNDIGGIGGLDPNGVVFYDTDDDANLSEFLWSGTIGNPNTTQEKRYFPPSQNGEGQVNPSHNLVSAFPMLSGFPATLANGYNPQDPYSNRDPRLKEYIVTNGSSFAGETIISGLGGGVDRLDSIPGLSTTTGYYLKKLLRPDVRLNDDGTETGKRHFNVYFRYTELFLILAEAANEIGGPANQINGMSANDIVGAIRQRAGISQPDLYLATITSKEQMRELIRNERRLELSFEGHRFWDIRRWGLPLSGFAEGYFNNGENYVELPTVEARNYPSQATYMPIPQREILKFSELEQNQGW